MTVSAIPPVLGGIVGQPRAQAALSAALRTPVHAYLFVGPAGTGKLAAALAFAAGLCCPNGGCGRCESCVAVLGRRHPDVVVFERRGASLSVDEARQVSELVLRAPRVAPRQVVVLVDVHLAERAVPALLKSVEEPADSTVVVALAEAVPPVLTTLASRCVEIVFAPIGVGALRAVLEEEGVAPERAELAAAAAGGRLDRARLYAREDRLADRLQRWREVPDRLDGTGAAAAELAAELLALANEPVAVLRTRQGEELAELQAAAERAGERGVPGRAVIEDRHRRELRRVRVDALRAGLGELAASLGGRAGRGDLVPHRIAAALAGVAAVEAAAAALERNPNESLLLQDLFCRLGDAR